MEETFTGWNVRGFFSFFFFPLQILTIPVKAVIAVGSLTCSPKHVFLPPSFPVRELSHSITSFLAVFFICLSFSRETAVLNCCMSKCWRDCAMYQTVMIQFVAILGHFFFPPHLLSTSYPFISSAACLDGILEYCYNPKPDSLQLYSTVAVVVANSWALAPRVRERWNYTKAFFKFLKSNTKDSKVS